jgi:hypothetical protein
LIAEGEEGAVPRRYGDYLPDGGELVDLADLIDNSVFEDPEPRIWIVPVDADEPAGQWSASCQSGEECVEFCGSRDEVIAWARRTPATCRFLRVGEQDVRLSSLPGDAPPPPPAGPTVEVRGPNHDGRWVAIWFYRGEVEQFWATREEVVAWACAQPAERRRMYAEGGGWRPLER